MRWWAVGAAAVAGLALLTGLVGYALSGPVEGDSMKPALHGGDRVIADPFGDPVPHRLDVVALHPPGRTATVVKRVVGVAGDRVRISGARVLVQPAGQGPWLVLEGTGGDAGPCCTADGKAGEDAAVLVPDGGYFVLGDNLTASTDSREYGFVARGDLVGVVWRRVWPPGALGEVPAPRLVPAG